MDKDHLDKVLDNQLSLIERLKEENQKLIINSQRFEESNKILWDNDYYVICSIDPLSVLNVVNVPSAGLIGYSQSEFQDNTYNWTEGRMFTSEEINRINLEHSKRTTLAKDLALNHFDIRLTVEFIKKDKSFAWAHYVSFYDMIKNEVKMYVKFVPIPDQRIKN